MSRGPGRVQVAIMQALERGYDEFGRPEVWQCVSTLDLGLSEHRESRRRAAHQLARAGLAELCRAAGEIDVASAHYRSNTVARSLLFARLPYGRSLRTHTRQLRREYEHQLRVFHDLEAEDRDRHNAELWIAWYRQPERTLTDLGDDVELVTFNESVQSTALQRLRDRPRN